MNRLRLYLLVVSFAVGRISAQDDTSRFIRLDSIPPGGLGLDKGWTYIPGDDPRMADVQFDGQKGLPVDPSGELHHLPAVRNSGIGWFRLNLLVDSAIRNKTVACVISGLGAIELYLNGNLIARFGKVSEEYETEQTRYFTNHLVSLTFGPQTDQVLAIRHSFHPKNLYLKFTFDRPIARIILKEVNVAFTDHLRENNFDATLRSVQVSFYLPLGLLLLFLYLSFRPRKEYLFSGIFCLCMFAAILLHIFALSEPTTVSRSNYLLYATQVFYIIGSLSFIWSTYILYNTRRNFFFYFIILYGITSLTIYFFTYDYSGLFNAVFFPLINFEFLRLSWQAFARKRKGAGVLLLTSILLAVSLLLYIWFTVNQQFEASAYLQSISFIIPGIGLSFFYAGEFARTASDLIISAREVEELSDEMIAAEREKQQILEAQNETLERQVQERTAALQKSLKELKETEDQLIQREKMASLGELTAGIAHEIQNPLNFVNNFSEVNIELIDELKSELKQGKLDGTDTIAEDIRNNNDKINYHGKRADSIVKGMLQHSRGSSGLKEQTDINHLADECLRLSFHGWRAKERSFHTSLDTNFDPSVGKINVVPQEIGRVILNLLNNAFYAVSEKKKKIPLGYEPCVELSTLKGNSHVEIRVRDNGNGIPDAVKEKIFQPFFTTKPTGEGTGLGLSLAYDIITKVHGGELKVETKSGEGSEFIILLPNT